MLRSIRTVNILSLCKRMKGNRFNVKDVRFSYTHPLMSLYKSLMHIHTTVHGIESNIFQVHEFQSSFHLVGRLPLTTLSSSCQIFDFDFKPSSSVDSFAHQTVSIELHSNDAEVLSKQNSLIHAFQRWTFWNFTMTLFMILFQDTTLFIS